MRFLPIIFIALLIITVWWSRRDEIRYVPLGDSYTFGQGVDPEDSWPQVLTRDLQAHGVKIELVTNPAGTGKATTEVISEQLPIFDRSSPTFTTLLIGVNDFNRGFSKETFQTNLRVILDHVQARLSNPKNIVLITIPDFSVTPTGKSFGDPKGNSAGITAFNEIIKAEAKTRSLPIVDIFPLSQDMGRDPSLLVPDGLHPSAKEYTLWEKLIFPDAYRTLVPTTN